MINRRNLFKASVSVATIAMLTPTSSLANAVLREQAKSNSFSYSMFKKLQGTQFSISTGLLGQVDTQLAEVIESAVSPHVEQFVTNFIDNGNTVNKLEEGLYDVYHEHIGWFQLHLKPLEKQGKNECYQATFCLLT